MNTVVENLRPSESALSPIGSEFLVALRNATSSKHKVLDDIVPLMSPALTAGQLAKYLQDIARFHQGMEEHLDCVLPSALMQWQFQARMPLIRSDLAVLGKNSPPNVSEGFLDWHSVDFLSETVLAGWLYVLEGSALGGAVIYKHLRQVLAADKADQLRFFRPYGNNPVNHWREFQQRLLAVANTHPDAPTQIIDAANQAFDWYARAILESIPIQNRP